MTRFFILSVFLAAACTPLSDRLAVSPTPSELQLRSTVNSVMVRTVSLPTYAAIEEIAFQLDDGTLAINEDILWADDPERATTLMVTRTLADILQVTTGPDPWPFVERPSVSVDIRVERMLGGTDGTFELTGQYFIAGEAGAFRNRSTQFSFSVPMDAPVLTALPAAQSRAVLLLSEAIARDLGR